MHFCNCRLSVRLLQRLAGILGGCAALLWLNCSTSSKLSCLRVQQSAQLLVQMGVPS
jgi:hypothetical protein